MSNYKKLLLFVKYNYPKVDLFNIDTIVSEFEEVLSLENEICACNKETRAKAINVIWDAWHCTRCLKPIEQEKQITVTFREIMDVGHWAEYCKVYGTNEWCVNEGADDNTEVKILISEAKKWSLI